MDIFEILEEQIIKMSSTENPFLGSGMSLSHNASTTMTSSNHAEPVIQDFQRPVIASTSNLLNEDELEQAEKSNLNDNQTGDDTQKRNDDEKKDESIFECNICLDTAKDAVVSMCGHLFCWPCLHRWLETRPTRKLCPVCKAAISKEKVIPLYGRGSGKQEDPRNKVPPRPAGQRAEPEQAPGFQGFGFGDGGFHMSFGIGAFPFGYFASSFNFGEPRPAGTNQRATTQYEDEQQLSKLFLYLAVLCIGWLLFA